MIPEKFLWLVALVFVILGFSGMAFLSLLNNEPEYRWWLTDEEQKWAYCQQTRPMLNISPSRFDASLSLTGKIDPRISEWCYGKLWSDYCKISYPAHCPLHKEEVVVNNHS